MQFFLDLVSNFALVSAGAGWFIAQFLKVFTGVFKLQKFSVSALLFGTGGMPSSHTAAVCAMATGFALSEGVGSGYFALSVLLCLIVMRDATGVRREAGKQAKVLNHIMHDLVNSEHPEEFDENLKELVGHTPLQVFVGAVVGIAVPFLMALIPYYNQYLPII